MTKLKYLTEFAHWLGVKGYSTRTIEAYQADAGHFLAFCRNQKLTNLTTVTPQDLYAFQLHLYNARVLKTGQRLHVCTRNRYLSSVKAFFRCMKAIGRIHSDPSSDIPHSRQPQQLPRAIPTHAEIRQILAAPDKSTAAGFRDACMLELFYSSGIRVTELVNLTTEDLSLDDGVMQIRQGKGGKDSVVPIGRHATNLLRHYLAKIRPHLKAQDNPSALFLTGQGRAFAGRRMIR